MLSASGLTRFLPRKTFCKADLISGDLCGLCPGASQSLPLLVHRLTSYCQHGSNKTSDDVTAERPVLRSSMSHIFYMNLKVEYLILSKYSTCAAASEISNNWDWIESFMHKLWITDYVFKDLCICLLVETITCFKLWIHNRTYVFLLSSRVWNKRIVVHVCKT